MSSPDHATEHRTLGSAVGTIENVLGTTAGTSVLSGFNAGDFPVRGNAGTGTTTLQQVATGTFTNSQFSGGTISGTTLVGGTLNATTGTFNNGVIGTPTIQGWDGWIQELSTWTSLGTDLATGTLSVAKDVTAIYQIGHKVKFTAGGSVQYGIISSMGAFASGSTSFTVYSGTYAYSGSAITSTFYSSNKDPFGFNADPANWQQSTNDTSARTASSPGVGTWYQPGTLQIIVPVGKWQLSFQAAIGGDLSANNCGAYGALSTTTNTPSDTDLQGATWAYNSMVTQMYKSKYITLSTKGTYTLIISPVFSSQNSIYIRGDTAPTKIYAVSSLL